MNPTQEQVNEALTDLERIEIIREAQRLEREAELIWRQYCMDNGIVEEHPKRGISDAGKFWLGYFSLICFIGALVVALLSK